MERGTIKTATASGRGRIAPANTPDQPKTRVSFTSLVFEAHWDRAIPGRAVDFDRLNGTNTATRVVLVEQEN